MGIHGHSRDSTERWTIRWEMAWEKLTQDLGKESRQMGFDAGVSNPEVVLVMAEGATSIFVTMMEIAKNYSGGVADEASQQLVPTGQDLDMTSGDASSLLLSLRAANSRSRALPSRRASTSANSS